MHEAIGPLTGASGLAMVRAIVEGQREPEKRLALCHAQIRDNKAGQVTQASRKRRWAQGRTVNASCILELHHMLVNLYQGNDLAVLPAYTDDNMLQIVSDVGTDLSK